MKPLTSMTQSPQTAKQIERILKRKEAIRALADYSYEWYHECLGKIQSLDDKVFKLEGDYLEHSVECSIAYD